jgi:hypothetical protein
LPNVEINPASEDKSTQTEGSFIFKIPQDKFQQLKENQKNFVLMFMKEFDIADSKDSGNILQRLESRKMW